MVKGGLLHAQQVLWPLIHFFVYNFFFVKRGKINNNWWGGHKAYYLAVVVTTPDLLKKDQGPVLPTVLKLVETLFKTGDLHGC